MVQLAFGKGVSLKITYADMKGITRSHAAEHIGSAWSIYRDAVKLLDQVERRPVRLVGVSIYNLAQDKWRQLSFEDLLGEASAAGEEAIKKALADLGEKYRLDFAGHLDQIYQGEVLHRTVEYMRKSGISS